MKLAIIGAGRTGRGFIARLFTSQAQIYFFDSDRELIEKLRGAGRFAVRYFDGRETDYITGYHAFWTGEPCDALTECECVFVSVGAENTGGAGKWLEPYIRPDAAVIACENAPLPSALFHGALRDRAGSGAIFCTTVSDGALDIAGESVPTLYTDDKVGVAASLSGIEIVPDFAVLMQRKLYTYNAASAIIAYLGAQKGYEAYADAANDPQIESELDRFYVAINAAVCAEYGIETDAQARFAALSKLKFQNRSIADSISRNAASPERKLSPSERIVMPARLISKHGGDTAPLIKTAVAALRYMGAADAARAREILLGICNLTPGEALFEGVMRQYQISR